MKGLRHKNIHPRSPFSLQPIATKRNSLTSKSNFFDTASCSSLNNPSKLELASMSQKLSPIQGNHKGTPEVARRKQMIQFVFFLSICCGEKKGMKSLLEEDSVSESK